MKKNHIHKIVVAFLLLLNVFTVYAQTDQFRVLDGVPHLPVFANTTSVSSPEPGMFIYSTANQSPMYYDGTDWIGLCSTASIIASVNNFQVKDKIPYLTMKDNTGISETPSSGSVYVDKITGKVKVHNGTDWVDFTTLKSTNLTDLPGFSSYKEFLQLPVLASDPNPVGLGEGAVYISSSDKAMRFYDGSAWQSISCVLIISPSEGDEWVNHIAHTISWTAPPGGSTYNISYSIDGGSNWNPIVNNVAGTSYNWTPSANFTSYENDVVIKVYDNTFDSEGLSGLFTVYPELIVNINRSINNPVCGNLDPGEFNLTISGGSGNHTIQWYEDDDSDLSLDATSVGMGTSNYNPSEIHADYKASNHTHYVGAVVTDDALTNISKEVEVGFNYSANCLLVTAPSTGDEWVNNISQTISWNAAPDGTSYDLNYSIDGGTTWNSIANNVSVTSYNWTPSLYFTSYENDVKIKVYDDAYNTEAESGLFTVYPPLTVSIQRTENTGPVCEDLDPGKFTLTIAGGSGNHSIQWYEDDDNDFNSDATSVGSGTTEYNPTEVSAAYISTDHTHYVGAIVTDNTLTNIEKSVELNFSYTKTCLIVTAPSTGYELANNEIFTIQWTAAPGGTTYDISYSLDGGITWLTLMYDQSGMSMLWQPLGITTYENNVKIKVHDDTYNTDAESGVFTIYQPITAMVSRTGSGGICEDLDPGSFNVAISGGSGDHTIQWYEDDDSDLASDGTTVGSGATTYDPSGIEATYLGTDHTHYVGATVTDNVLSSVSTEHELSFEYKVSCIELTAPLAGAIWVNNSSHSITWTNSVGSSNYKLEYSDDNGSSWNTIVESTTGTSYSWTPSAISTYNTTVKIKLTDINTSKEVVSDAITVYPPITVSVSRSGSGEVCSTNDPGSFTVSYSGGSGSLTAQWYENSSSSLSSGTVVGDGSNSYDPSQVHSNYSSYNHTHYVGVEVSDALLGVNTQNSSSFYYKASCGPPFKYIETRRNEFGQYNYRFVFDSSINGYVTVYSVGTYAGGQWTSESNYTIVNGYTSWNGNTPHGSDWLQILSMTLYNGSPIYNFYSGKMYYWEAPKQYYD